MPPRSRAGHGVDGSGGRRLPPYRADDDSQGNGGCQSGARNKRDAAFRGDQGEQRRPIVDPMPDVGGEAGGDTGRRRHLPARPPFRADDPGFGREIAEIDVRLVRQAVTLRQHHAHGIAKQVASLMAGVAVMRRAAVIDGDHDIQLAGVEEGEGVRRLDLAHDDRESGVIKAEAGKGGGDDGRDRRREGSDRHPARGGVVEGREIGARAFQRRVDHHRVFEKDQGLRRQTDATTGGGEQRHADLPRQIRDLLGNGGRGETQRLGGGGDGLALAQFAENAQTANVDR